jgi:amino acid adenylation domain-containing protein
MTDLTLLDCFKEVRVRTPDAIAITSETGNVSYQSIDHFSNVVAQAILHSAEPEDRSVVLMMGRDSLVISGMLAILKTGKICIPLHPVNNEARMLDSVFDDHQTPLILTDSKGVTFLEQLNKTVRVINLERLDKNQSCESPNIQTSASDPAFVIYTSGSTGTPKGVLHTHQAMVARIIWYHQQFNINEQDTTLMLSSADSISGIVGMFRPLLTGGRLIVFSIRRQGFDAMTRTIREQGVTLLPMVNSVFRHFVDSLQKGELIPSVRLIILGGEAMTSGDVSRYREYFSEDCLLLNTLGCTELPTYRFFTVDRQYQNESPIVPVGHAVPGNEVIIIDDAGNPVEAGVMGEIAIKSNQLALGYWNRTEETESRFFKTEDNTPCYKTGDLGILQPNDLLKFMGRRDGQVKILGNRVELAEIENALEEHPQIRTAAVGALADDPERVQLYANVIFTNPESPCLDTDLVEYLSQRVPDYMIPLHFINARAIPLTRTGKVDRKALLQPDKDDLSRTVTVEEEPHSPTEWALTSICKEILQIEHLGTQTNLLSYGANSLLMMV